MSLWEAKAWDTAAEPSLAFAQYERPIERLVSSPR